jgi:lipopolysaccharide export system ATP-binding protein
VTDDRAILDALLAQVEHCDLSALITLRVLLREPRADSWISPSALVRDVEREFARLESAPQSALLPAGPPWDVTPAPAAEEQVYLEQHVVRMLRDLGLVEEREPEASGGVSIDEEEEPEGSWIRLAEPLRDHRPILRDRVDRRLAGVVNAPEEARAAAPRMRHEPASTLSASGLVKVYRKRRVVNDVALHVSQGEIVGLLGPNGAGKTTTFYMMVGLIPPDSGRVSIGAEDVTDTPMFRRARKGIGYLAQEPSIFRKLTVEENVLAILQMLKLSKREREARLEMLLDELGIKHLRHSKAYALSGGERRRLEITRALVGRPKFMLLDEPFAGVDPIAVHDIQQIVADLRQRNIGVLISDHNVEQTLDIVDRAYIMYEGRVRVSGTVSELVWNDEVAEIYLGPTLTARMRQRYTFPA